MSDLEIFSQEDSERRRKFFYAEQETGMYDETIQLVVPHYDLMHQSILDLLRYHFGIPQGVKPERVHGVILDIGAGTGAESISILREFPNIKIVALDLCSPMIDRFKANYKKAFGDNSSIDERCKFIQGDILDETILPRLSELCLDSGSHGYTAIISAFTLHHLSTEQKKRAYQITYQLLQEGGILLNGDLFKYKSVRLSQYVHDYDLKWIAQQFSNPNEKFTGAKEISKYDRDNLSAAWQNHYLVDNHLDSIEDQLGMLKAIGFREYGNPFSFWQVGILYGLK
jgi:ubiquinone/menaquinone biosynthesis C-methylase UbiE